MRKYIFLVLLLLLLSCSNSQQKIQNKQSNATLEETETAFSEMFEIVSVETGWYQEQQPQIKIKFKNVSGKSINETIFLKYRFIENNEVFDEGTNSLHYGSDIAWDNGLCKTETYRSSYGYEYGGHLHKVRVKVCFEDNSLIWEGDIKQRIIY